MLAYSLQRDCKKKRIHRSNASQFWQVFHETTKEGEQRQNRTESKVQIIQVLKQIHSCYGNISKAIVHNTFISKNIYFCILAASYNFKWFDNTNSDGLNNKLYKLLTP